MELDDLPKEKLKELIHEVTDDIDDDEMRDYGDENLVDDDANLDVVLMIIMMEVQHNLVFRRTSHDSGPEFLAPLYQLYPHSRISSRLSILWIFLTNWASLRKRKTSHRSQGPTTKSRCSEEAL